MKLCGLWRFEENKLPFIRFHLDPVLFFGLLLSTAFDPPTFLIANVLPDVEPFAIIFFNVRGYPLHGFFHSYMDATIFAAIIAVCMYLLRGFFGKVMRFFHLQSYFKKIVFASLAGAYFHVFVDSFLYREMMLLYPLGSNVFSAYSSCTVICVFCGIAAFFGINHNYAWLGKAWLFGLSTYKIGEQPTFF